MADRTGEGPILFAYDGSEQAKAAIREAARQLNAGRAAIVLTVWQPLAALPFAPATGAADIEASIETEARSVAEEGATLARSVGFDATTSVAEDGTPVWSSIVSAADDGDASIVVMGSHGRTGIGLVLMGSVAAAVARHTERPVLIVHARSEEGAG